MSLTELANCGIGVHHAGLSLDDRKTTEELFLGGLLRVICATSVCVPDSLLLVNLNIVTQTLAVGVNLRGYQIIRLI